MEFSLCVTYTCAVYDYKIRMEAWTGFGPVNEGFADPCLTTWLPRLDVMPLNIHSLSWLATLAIAIFCFFLLFMHFFPLRL